MISSTDVLLKEDLAALFWFTMIKFKKKKEKENGILILQVLNLVCNVSNKSEIVIVMCHEKT